MTLPADGAHDVFVTGGTGYIGRPLIERLVARGHAVRALVREESVSKVPSGATPVLGNALEAGSFAEAVPPADTLVHLVGVPHPNPMKARAFRSVDLASVRASAEAARGSTLRHFVYVSVAQPAPVMRAYGAARQEGEALVRASGVPATFLRPWYVLGPGHYWPYVFVPLYAVFERLGPTQDAARRLGLVTHGQMVAALVHAVESPTNHVRIVEVPHIREAARTIDSVSR